MAIAAPVQHAVVQHVEVWRDASGEYAFRFLGDTRVRIVRGTTAFTVEDGALVEHDRYPSAAAGWRVVAEQFAVTRAQTAAALAAGDGVARPALMTLPTRRAESFTDVNHFGPDIGALRHAVPWWVPSPGPIVAGLRLSDDSVVSESMGRVALQEYDAGKRILVFETAAPGSEQARDDARFFRLSHQWVDANARFASGGLIVRRGASYVSILTQEWGPTPSQWRAIAAAARA